jgi:hypothetical protein
MAEVKPNQTLINWTGTALTAYLCTLLTYLTWALVNGLVNATFRDVVVGLVGFITGKLSTAYDWHYGTSSGNKQAQATIDTLASTAAAVQSALPPTPGSEKSIPVAEGEQVTVKGVGEK